MSMTPYELVRDRFDFPFDLYPFQVEAVNELAVLPRTGIYWECGCGKTAGATHCALYHALYEVDTVVGILPP
jgi:superfamily II DNA or RNA helicase